MLSQSDKRLILKMHKEISIYAPWTNSVLFKKIIDELSKPFLDLKVDKVLGVESRGFILGGAVAYKLNSGFVLARKKNKIYQYKYPKNLVFSEECIDYSGMKKGLEIEKDGKGINKGDNVVVIDDWYGTGGQGNAAIRLVEKAGGKVIGVGIMLDWMSDETRKSFAPYNFHTLIRETIKTDNSKSKIKLLKLDLAT